MDWELYRNRINYLKFDKLYVTLKNDAVLSFLMCYFTYISIYILYVKLIKLFVLIIYFFNFILLNLINYFLVFYLIKIKIIINRKFITLSFSLAKLLHHQKRNCSPPLFFYRHVKIFQLFLYYRKKISSQSHS